MSVENNPPVSESLMPEQSDQLIASSPEVPVPTPHGLFGMRAWAFADGAEHISLRALDNQGQPVPFSVRADSVDEENLYAPVCAPEFVPAVRIHSECATGDLFGSYRCDCGPQLEQGLSIISRHGGYLLYMRHHEGRGIGLVNKLRAYALQDQGLDTVDANLELGLPAEARQYSAAARILHELGAEKIALVSNNPAKQQALSELGIDVVTRIPDEIPARAENARYLDTKRTRMHHLLSL